jgi:hypothetical protein
MPAIPTEVDPMTVSGWWVRIDQTDSLEAAYRFLKSLPKNAPAVRIIPYWNPREGMQFALVLGRHFKSRSIADRRLKQLPPELADSGQLVSSWASDTIFFSDPYFGTNNRGKRD